MNGDKINRIFMYLCIFLGVVSLSVGKFIIGGIALAVAIAIKLNGGSGKYNDRNLYDKIVEIPEDFDIMELFGKIEKLETPLGKPWVDTLDFAKGKAIILGPGAFKDFIVIYKKGKILSILSGTDISKLNRNEATESHFRELLDTKNMKVTPKNFSAFAGDKMVTVNLINDLTELLENIVSGDEEEQIPEQLDCYQLRYVNSSDYIYRDLDDNEYAYVDSSSEPLMVKIREVAENEAPYDSGEEMADVSGDEKEGYVVKMSGEDYGVLFHDNKSSKDSYYIETPKGKVVFDAFMATQKGNLSCNYKVDLNGKRIAIVGGSARIRFEDNELTQNSIICSIDDDYLLLYMAVLELIMKKSKWLK